MIDTVVLQMKQYLIVSVFTPILAFPAIINNINGNFTLSKARDKNISGYVKPVTPFTKKEKDNKKLFLTMIPIVVYFIAIMTYVNYLTDKYGK